MGDGIAMLQGFPILNHGTGNMALIRGLIDLEHWFRSTHSGRDIHTVRKHALQLTLGKHIDSFSACEGDGTPGASSAGGATSPCAIALHSTRLMLPIMDHFGRKHCFESPAYFGLPKNTEPISETDEKHIVEMLAQVLNSTFMTDLALEIVTARDSVGFDGSSSESTLSGKRFVLVGASHTARLACALEDSGAMVIDLSVPGWRATSESVATVISELSSVLEEEYNGETFVIYQLYDNSSYLACSPDGDRSLPVKLGDGRYHVPGRLVFVDRAGFRELFTITLPLLRAGKNHTKILLTPIMRYALAACCDNPAHVTNKREPAYGTALGEALSNIGEWLQDLAFTRRIRNFAVMCPTDVMQRADQQRKGNFWAEGPVHMTKDGYRFLADALLERFADVKLCRKVESKPPPAATSSQRKPDMAARRESWVGGNDSSVHRRYDTDSGRGYPGGQRGWRGSHRGWKGYRGGGRGGGDRGVGRSGSHSGFKKQFHKRGPY
jgi:hypothetical protein